jgi:hypothetical protein
MRIALLISVAVSLIAAVYGQSDDGMAAVLRPAPIFFKRSELTDAQIAMIEEEREINNLNVMLRRPVNGERLVLGSIASIDCSEGVIYFGVASEGANLTLFARRFGDINFSVLTAGTRAFTFRCGGRFPDERVAAIYRPAAQPAGVDGIVASLTFVPAHFRLKDLDAISREPIIVIEGLRPTDVEANVRAADAERADMERVTREARELERKNAEEAEKPASNDPGGEGEPLGLGRVTDLVRTGLRPDGHVDPNGVPAKRRRHRHVKPE